MSEIGHNSENYGDNTTADELRQFVERIEYLESEKKDIADQVKEVYAELKGRGFDSKAVRGIIAERKKDADELQEHEAIMNLYRQALGMALVGDL